MEIERKFLIDDFPAHLPLLSEAVMHQGYISTHPVVRIRSTTILKHHSVDTPAALTGETTYVLCFKGEGTLVREEIETSISKELFLRLARFIGRPLIRKDFKTYRLPDETILECSFVNAGTSTSFFYAEVEFSNTQEANAFVPPPFLKDELTEQTAFTMSSYWENNMQTEK